MTPKQRNRRSPTRKEEEENRLNLTKQGIETEKPSETDRIRQNGIAKVLVSFEANQRAEGGESKTQQQTNQNKNEHRGGENNELHRQQNKQ